jgi:hypothetical protein
MPPPSSGSKIKASKKNEQEAGSKRRFILKKEATYSFGMSDYFQRATSCDILEDCLINDMQTK